MKILQQKAYVNYIVAYQYIARSNYWYTYSYHVTEQEAKKHLIYAIESNFNDKIFKVCRFVETSTLEDLTEVEKNLNDQRLLTI